MTPRSRGVPSRLAMKIALATGATIALVLAVTAASARAQATELRAMAPSATWSDVEALFSARHEQRDADARLEDAQDTLVERCMAAKGYEISLPRRPIHGIAGRVWPSVAHRSRYGYGGPGSTPTRGLSTHGLRARIQTKALVGDEDHVVAVPTPIGGNIRAGVEGCLARGRTALWGSVRDFVEGSMVTSDYIFMAGAWAWDHPDRTGVVNRRWARCMRARGHSYRSPDDPVREFGLEGLSPSPREIKAATDDAACQMESRQPHTVSRLIRVHLDALDTSDKGHLVSCATLRLRALQRADDVLDR